MVIPGNVGANYSQWPAKGQSSYKWQILSNLEGFCEESRKDRNSCEKFCKLSDFKRKFYCYELCTFCHPAATKERHKTHFKSNKISERCVLCKSVVFWPTCHKSPHYCSKFAYRGQTEPVLENLGRPRDQPQGHKYPQWDYTPPPFQNQPSS